MLTIDMTERLSRIRGNTELPSWLANAMPSLRRQYKNTAKTSLLTCLSMGRTRLSQCIDHFIENRLITGS